MTYIRIMNHTYPCSAYNDTYLHNYTYNDTRGKATRCNDSFTMDVREQFRMSAKATECVRAAHLSSKVSECPRAAHPASTSICMGSLAHCVTDYYDSNASVSHTIMTTNGEMPLSHRLSCREMALHSHEERCLYMIITRDAWRRRVSLTSLRECHSCH